MKKIFTTILSVLVALSFLPSTVTAQQSSFDLKKASNQYNATGTVTVSKNGTVFTYSAVVKDLPSTLPANGLYYLLWGLTVDGRADNLGPITNSSENRGNLNGRITQFFITSEKERFPEFVTGPRIAQTDAIAESVFVGIASPTPQTSASPTSKSSASPSIVPVGGPVGAPETGLGGALLFNGLIYTLGGIGFTGLGISLFKKNKAKIRRK
jgi:hypothetical protein